MLVTRCIGAGVPTAVVDARFARDLPPPRPVHVGGRRLVRIGVVEAGSPDVTVFRRAAADRRRRIIVETLGAEIRTAGNAAHYHESSATQSILENNFRLGLPTDVTLDEAARVRAALLQVFRLRRGRRRGGRGHGHLLQQEPGRLLRERESREVDRRLGHAEDERHGGSEADHFGQTRSEPEGD